MENINHSLRDYATVRPGVAIINPLTGEIGTIGFLAENKSARWIVSCYHVLGPRAEQPWPAGAIAPVFYPADTLRNNPIALVDNAMWDEKLDCAAARLSTDRPNYGVPLGLGALTIESAMATVGQLVLKSGGVTGVTEGYVSSVTEGQIEIVSRGLSPGYRLSEPGDSGALWVDAQTRAPIGLHRGGGMQNSQVAYAVPVGLILKKFNLKIVVKPS